MRLMVDPEKGLHFSHQIHMPIPAFIPLDHIIFSVAAFHMARPIKHGQEGQEYPQYLGHLQLVMKRKLGKTISVKVKPFQGAWSSSP